MVLRLEPPITIDNPQRYSQEIVDKLGALLAAGAEAMPDPHRHGFYDVSNGSRMFYIHVSPVSGKVFLLAIWQQAARKLQVSPAA